MLRKILTLTLVAGALSAADAQEKFKFGVHIDPTISFMGSNNKAVTADGSNFAFRFGMQGDVYLDEKQNYAFTFGTGFIMGAGGTLKYRDGGNILQNTELDKNEFRNNLGAKPASGENLLLPAGTTVKYAVNYVPISAGFKITTNEFAGSYLRAFFHLPTLDVMIPVSARGKVSAPADGIPSATTDPNYSTQFYAGETSGENVYKEIYPIQIMAGVGAGVEWSPTEEKGIRLIGGIYYSSAVIDVNKSVRMYDPDNKTINNATNPRNAFQNIALRVGVMF